MTDLQRILALVARTRRRLRTQAFLEWATTASVPAVAAALVVLWLWRMRWIGDGAALASTLLVFLAVLAAGLAGALRQMPLRLVASRLDRASDLSDRLGTACEFADRIGDPELHPQTVAMMQAAIADANHHVDRADPKKAAPFRLPADTRPAAVFLGIAAAVLVLAWRPEATSANAADLALRDQTARELAELAEKDKNALDEDDLDYSRDYVKELAALADQTNDPHLKEFADKLEELLDKAAKGEISKEQMLAEMEKLEKHYMEGSDADLDSTLADLKELGKELEKEPLTKRLGEAMSAGDMEAAAKEMEKLGEQMEKQELTPEQQKRVADALDKAAKKQEELQKKRDEKEKQDDKKAEQQIQKKKDEIKRLEKKQQENPEDQVTKKQLEKKKRELDQLEREQQQKKEQQAKKKERKLDRLSRDMKRSAENLKNQKPQEAKQDMEQAANRSRDMEEEMKKVENQKRAQSQLTDLKDSLRRAKAKNQKGQGKGQRQASRLQRIKEWEQRAGGGQGNPGAWKPGQRMGQGQQGQGQQGQQGKGQDGQQAGDQADPDSLNGDPTKMASKKQDKFVGGAEGRGPSRRETILTAAQKGFAARAYKQVYSDYKKIVEETMSAEKVPQGYKYYVKRYFQRIKPHSMD